MLSVCKSEKDLSPTKTHHSQKVSRTFNSVQSKSAKSRRFFGLFDGHQYQLFSSLLEDFFRVTSFAVRVRRQNRARYSLRF